MKRSAAAVSIDASSEPDESVPSCSKRGHTAPVTEKKYSLMVHKKLAGAENQPKVCPLCNSVVSLFQLNNDEKILMCSKETCPWPFGCDVTHIYNIAEDSDSSDSSENIVTNWDWATVEKIISTPTLAPTGANREENILKPIEGNNAEALKPKASTNVEASKAKAIADAEASLQENLKAIRALSKELYENDHPEIVNIRYLAQMQQRTGIRVLTKDEMEQAKKMLPDTNISSGELTIDIDVANQSISVNIAKPNE